MIAVAALALLAAIAWTAIASVLFAGLWPLVRGRIARFAPALRERVLLATACAPATIGALVATLCVLPGAAGMTADHCLAHESGHVHLCLAHPPSGLGALGAAILAAVLAASFAATTLAIARLLSEAARIRLLSRTALPEEVRGCRVVESRVPLAFAIGALRPRVLVSTGLLSSLPDRLLDAVLAHERAHARRRDGLRRFAVAALATAHVPWVGRALTRDHARACEQACDEEAALRVGDRLTVAEAILAVARRLGSTALVPDGAIGFTGGQVGARVEALAASAIPAGRDRLALAGLAVGFVLALAASAPVLHDLTEHLLHHLAR